MGSKYAKALKFTAVVIATTAVFALIVLNAQGKALTELKTVEIIEFFFAIPLLATVFYLVLSAKFEEFNSRLIKIEKSLDRTVKELETEEEELTGEEKTLKQEIRELRAIAEDIHRAIGGAKANKRARR